MSGPRPPARGDDKLASLTFDFGDDKPGVSVRAMFKKTGPMGRRPDAMPESKVEHFANAEAAFSHAMDLAGIGQGAGDEADAAGDEGADDAPMPDTDTDSEEPVDQ